MRVIAVDIGNSACKLAVKLDSEHRDLESDVFERPIRWFGDAMPSDLERRLPEAPCQWWISSVHASKEDALVEWIKRNRPADRVQLLTHDAIPIESEVDQRMQVGKDRLLAALGAKHHLQIASASQTPAVVIDAGTAVTVDLVDAKGVFQGGNIFLGADTMLRQISARADALPDLDYASRKKRIEHWRSDRTAITHRPKDFPIGKNTVDAILNGVYRSQWGGLIHLVDQITRSFDRDSLPCVVVTGGGWFELIDAMESLDCHSNDVKTVCENWIVDRELVLRGILMSQLHAEELNR